MFVATSEHKEFYLLAPTNHMNATLWLVNGVISSTSIQFMLVVIQAGRSETFGMFWKMECRENYNKVSSYPEWPGSEKNGNH